jgi:transposase
VYLKTALVEIRSGAVRAKGTYLLDKFYRLKARRGYKRAAVAIAHKIRVSIYHMLSQKVSYNDLGDLYLDRLNTHHLTRNLVHRLERLGFTVTLTPSRTRPMPPRGGNFHGKDCIFEKVAWVRGNFLRRYYAP